jgi:tricorn protease-like protein
MRADALAPVFGILLLIAAPLPAFAEDRGFTAEDLVTLARLSEPVLAPDGRRVAYVVRETDLDANRGRTDVWMLDLANRDAAPVRLTRHEAGESNPRWSPDGRALYFLSTRSGKSQVWRLPLEGGEPLQVTDLAVDVASLSCPRAGTASRSPRACSSTASISPARPSACANAARTSGPAASTTSCSCATGTRGATGGATCCIRLHSTRAASRPARR